VNKSLPTRTLPEHPHLDQLRRQAKDVLEQFLSGDSSAIAEVNTHYRDADPETFALHDAQFVVARQYGFDSWPKLKAYVDGVTVNQLVAAVRSGDDARVRALLKTRPELVNIDVSEGDEHRALHYAVLARSASTVRLLMQHHADARKGIWPNREATSALTMARERGYEDIVAIIEEEESKWSTTAGLGDPQPAPSLDPPLEQLMASGDEARIIALLEANPSLRQARFQRLTPLHVAAAMLWTDVVAWLLDRGADVIARIENGPFPMDAIASGRWVKNPTIERIATVASMLRSRGAPLTPRAAVILGEADWLRAQHAEGKLENVIGDSGGLLSLAVRHNKSDILKLLLDLGFDPDERVRLQNLDEIVFSSGGPLHLCAGAGKLAMAEMLLEHGANPNAQVYASGSILFRAYQQKDWAFVKLVERYGGQLDAANAGYLAQTEVAKQLFAADAAGELREGAVPKDRTLAETLLWSAAGGGDPEIVRMSLDRIDWPRDDPRWHYPLWQALTSDGGLQRGLECYRLILDRANPNISVFGRTLLHDAVASGKRLRVSDRAPYVNLLLDAGARMDLRDELLQSTPLGWACRWGHVELVQLLLERGADPEEADAESWAKPKAWATKMGHDAVSRLLQRSP
jgi:ankyrin repeat protein